MKKRLLQIALAVLLLIVFGVLGLMLALQSRGVRQALLAQISQATEESVDVGLSADDFHLDLGAGMIEVEEVELFKTGQPEAPFLKVARIALRLQIPSLWSNAVRFREVKIEQPVLSLAAPRPEFETSSTSSDPSGKGLEIENLKVSGAEILGDPALLSPDGWLSSWRMEAIDLSGSLIGETWHSELEKAKLLAARSDAQTLEFNLDAVVRGSLQGTVEIEQLGAIGDGLRLEAQGELGNGTAASGFDFTLDVDVASFLPDIMPRGHLSATGQFDPLARVGEVEAQAKDFPVSIVNPWLEQSILEDMGVADSSFDITADLHASSPEGARDLSGEGARDLSGEVTLHWHQKNSTLFDLTAETQGGRFQPDGTFDLADLLADAQLHAPALQSEILRPFIDRETSEQLGVSGTDWGLDADLKIDARASSPVTGLVDLFWRKGEEVYLKASAKSLESPSETTSTRWGFKGDLLPDLAGKRYLSGEWTAADWREPVRSTFQGIELILEEPEVSTLVRELVRRWPERIPAEVVNLQLPGSLAGIAQVAGPVDNPEARLDLNWQLAAGESMTLVAEGKPVEMSGRLDGQLRGLDLGRIPDWQQAISTEAEKLDLSGRMDGVFRWEGHVENFQMNARLDGQALGGSSLPLTVDHLTVELMSEGEEILLTHLDVTSEGRRASGEGWLRWEQPLSAGHLSFDLLHPLEGLERATVDIELEDGELGVQISEVETIHGGGHLNAYLPLNALLDVPALAESAEGWPVEKASGPLRVDFELPVLEWAEWVDLSSLGIQNLQAALQGEFQVELADLSSATGRLEVPFFNLATEEHSVDLSEPLTFELGQQRMVAQPFSLRADGQLFSVEKANLSLRSPLAFESDPSTAIESIDVVAQGKLPATLLQPFLEGGRAVGNFETQITARGALDALETRASLQGPDVELTILTPYLTRVRQPSFELKAQGTAVELENGRASLNRGEVRFSGTYGEEEGLLVEAQLEDVRYRLNYGLSVVASGAFDFSLDPIKVDQKTTGRLGGRLVLKRGILRRDLFLDRQVMSQLLAPTASGISEESLLDDIELDLELATTEGVRVKNNLADLRATWSPLRVRGTLTQPVIEGAIDVQPGGYVYALGQTVRLDEAVLTFPGDPTLEPDLKLLLTTSLEDPSIAREGASRFPVDFQTVQDSQPVSANDSVERGVAAYYGDQLAGQLGGLLGKSTRLNFGRPILIFNEADPSRRLTVVRDLSNYISLAASVDLGTEGEQTYVLDVHDLPRLPRLIGQVFTTDESDEGAALQQIIEFGGKRHEDFSQPLITKLSLHAPESVGRQALREALEFEQGDRWRDGADFDLEVDAAEFLRRNGFPEAVVKVETKTRNEEIEVDLGVETGPKVEFQFVGDKPPSKVQTGITNLYRIGFYQEITLGEMREEWTRLMRASGYLEPQVDISVVDLPQGDQKVTLQGSGGRKIDPGPPLFNGVDSAVASSLAERFPGTLARVQLALAEPAADRLLLDALRVLGYPEAEVVDRSLSENGKTLRVELLPGRRLQVGEIEIIGSPESLFGQLRGMVEIRSGDPARLDLLARTSLALELKLRSQGYAEAQVHGRFSETGNEGERNMILQVDAGDAQKIDEIRFQGQEVTKARWAERATGLKKGEVLDPKAVAQARRRLFDTRLFRSVLPSTKREDGRSILTFDLDEGPRYSFAYGFRWKSNDGLGVVFDVLDRNTVGRGVTLGLRGLYLENDASLRLYGAIPKIFGTQATLEMYLQGREFSEVDDFGDEIETSEIESSLQLAFPLAEKLKGRVYLRFNDRVVTAPDPFFPDLEFSIQRSNPVLGVQVFYDSRDDLLNARRGWFASADLSGSDEFLNSDFFYLRFFGQVQHFRRIATFGGEPVIWAQAWRVGLADAFRGQDVISEERFLAGGERSIRGYSDDSIGQGGILDGGEALFVLNQEVRFPVYNSLRGVVFFDAGNVWNSTRDFGDELLTSTGMGLRAETPIGLLRLDFAFPLDRREGDDASEIYLGFGQTF